MASKHSKNFFDFKKSCHTNANATKSEIELTLPFKVIIITLVLSLVLSAIFVGNFFMQSNRQKNILSDAKQIFESKNSGDALKALAQKNKDIKGWLKIEGTGIDCAVCQDDDDTFYTNHNQLGKKSRYGALFLSKNDSFTREGNDRNIVIFGNNMRDGTMFGSLKQYRKLNFYKQNPFVELYFGDESQKYIVFAVMLVSSSTDDSGEIYKPYKSHFANEGDFDNWYAETTARSLFHTSIKMQYGDDILTLVTVADDFDGARLVVMAKKIDDLDTNHIDMSETSVNAKIKYPEIWYTTRGLKYPH